ncbi:transposase, MuDR, partial [Tanacetum coccineum]
MYVNYVYGPKRTKAPRRVYKGGNADWFDDVDADGFSVIEVSGMLKELGYDNPKMKTRYKKPTSNLDKGLEPLSKDIDILDLLSYVCKSGNAGLGTHESDGLESGNAGLGTHKSDGLESGNAGLGTHKRQSSEPITSPHIETDDVGVDIQGSDNNEESDDSEESEDNTDSDFEYDIEDMIDDVHIDMEMFRKNTNASAEWVGSTKPEPEVENNDQFVPSGDSGSNVDGLVDGLSGSQNLNINDLELFRNSNFTFVIDRQKGIIPALVETFPCAEHRHCLKYIYDNMKLQWRGKLFKELLWRCVTATTMSHFNRNIEELKIASKDVYDWILYQAAGPHKDQCVVNVEERTCSCKKWDLTGMPCKHAVAAIWNMVENGLEHGIPETWVHPNKHTPIGRPLKKRKKSAAELCDGMVKDGICIDTNKQPHYSDNNNNMLNVFTSVDDNDADDDDDNEYCYACSSSLTTVRKSLSPAVSAHRSKKSKDEMEEEDGFYHKLNKINEPSGLSLL